MKTTSHFIWIELQAQLLSNIFVSVSVYLKDNNIEDCLLFQNPLSPHITLYYLEKELSDSLKWEIQADITRFDISEDIFITWLDYFCRWDGNRFVAYFTTQTTIPFKKYRDSLHEKYNRDFVEDNGFDFSPHITFLRVQDEEVFKKHREGIESVISQEIDKLKNINLNSWKAFLYAVNSKFKVEIQVKL